MRADAAECLRWSEQMKDFGRPAQPKPTILRSLNVWTAPTVGLADLSDGEARNDPLRRLFAIAANYRTASCV